jgi:hypothetical protein
LLLSQILPDQTNPGTTPANGSFHSQQQPLDPVYPYPSPAKIARTMKTDPARNKKAAIRSPIAAIKWSADALRAELRGQQEDRMCSCSHSTV